MGKDSQIDSKEVRIAKGKPPVPEVKNADKGRNNKKQSGSRHKPGNAR